MKKMILSAAIVAAMALGVSVNAQDTKEKKECTKTEQKCCKKEGKEACKKDKACDKKKDECCSKKKEAKWWSSHRSKELSHTETTLFFISSCLAPLIFFPLKEWQEVALRCGCKYVDTRYGQPIKAPFCHISITYLAQNAPFWHKAYDGMRFVSYLMKSIQQIRWQRSPKRSGIISKNDEPDFKKKEH